MAGRVLWSLALDFSRRRMTVGAYTGMHACPWLVCTVRARVPVWAWTACRLPSTWLVSVRPVGAQSGGKPPGTRGVQVPGPRGLGLREPGEPPDRSVRLGAEGKYWGSNECKEWGLGKPEASPQPRVTTFEEHAAEMPRQPWRGSRREGTGCPRGPAGGAMPHPRPPGLCVLLAPGVSPKDFPASWPQAPLPGCHRRTSLLPGPKPRP